jgi:hypothetical protein
MILMIGGLRILGAMCDSLHLPDNVLDTEEHSFSSLLGVLKWGRAIEEMEHCHQVFSIFVLHISYASPLWGWKD